MRKAIVKAVGAYVSTKSTLKNSDFKEEIIVNSDATVTRYNEIEAVERSGMWQIKIIAEVLPNEYLKYCPKLQSHTVSNIDIGNLKNQLVMAQNAEKTIFEIFRDYNFYIYEFKKNGNIRLATNSDLHGEEVFIDTDFIASINQQYYSKLHNRLCLLLDRIAIQKGQFEFNISTHDRYIMKNKNLNGVFNLLWDKSGISNGNVGDYNFIVLAKLSSGKLFFRLYLVPRKIYDMITKAIQYYYDQRRAYTYLVQAFYVQHQPDLIKYYFFIPGLNFYFRYGSWLVRCRAPITSLIFLNLLHAENIDNRYYKALKVEKSNKKCYNLYHDAQFYTSITLTSNVKIKLDLLDKIQKCYFFSTGIINNGGRAYIEHNPGLLQRLKQAATKYEENILQK